MLIEIIERTSAEYRDRVWRGERMINGARCRAVIGEAGRLVTPSRLASHTGSMTESVVVVRWVELAALRRAGPGLARAFADAVRWRSLVRVVFPALLGIACARGAAGFTALRALAILATLVCAHAAVNAVSEAVEHARGDDSLLRFGGSKVLQHGWLAPRQLVELGLGLAAVGLATGVATVMATRTWDMLAIGVAGVALASQFRLPPLQLSRTAVGELVVALLFGPILAWAVARMLGADAAVGSGGAGGAWRAAALGALPGLEFALRRQLHNLRRLPDDRMLDNRTLVTRLGFRSSQHLVTGLAIALIAAPLVLVALGAAAWPLALLAGSAPLIGWAVAPAHGALAPHHPMLSQAIHRTDLALLGYAALALVLVFAAGVSGAPH
jgi:1,4-dihydroxy-2-naphthoate octaprenyltransferase